MADGSFGRWKIPAARGGGGRAQRAQSMGGPPAPNRGGGVFWPPPFFFFWGPPGPPKTPPPPGVTQRLPPPLRQRASASHTAVGWGHRKEGADMRGAAAFGGQGGGPAGRPPGLPNKRAGPGAKGPGPALSGRFASCRGLQSSDSLSRYCANIAVRAAPAAGVELAVRVLPHSRCRAWFSPW